MGIYLYNLREDEKMPGLSEKDQGKIKKYMSFANHSAKISENFLLK